MNVNDSKKQGFVKGASILLGAMVVVKLLGAVFKLPIGNILTPVGMAYFNTAYQLFVTIYALTVTGFAAAMARMVAVYSAKGRYRDCTRLLRIAQLTFLLLGICGTVLMITFSSTFSEIVKMPHARYAMIAMAPAILFSCMMAAYRGYYEGLRNMTPTAISQIVEVMIKLVLGILFSYGVIAYAEKSFFASGMVFGAQLHSLEEAHAYVLPYAAAAAMIAISLSTLAGYLYMRITFHLSQREISPKEMQLAPAPLPRTKIFRQLFITALPITLSAVALNLTNMIDVMTITSRLKLLDAANPAFFESLYGAYRTSDQQMHELIYGSYTFALPFFSIISAFTALFGKSALPNVTAAFVSGDKHLLRSNIESVLRFTALIAIPTGIGLFVLSEEIISLFHGNIPGATVLIAPSLRILGIAAIFLGFTSPLYAIFQGVGRFSLPLLFVFLGGVTKIGVNLLLISLPQMNVRGAAYGSLFCYAVIVLFSLSALSGVTGIRFHYISLFWKPIVAGILCGLTAKLMAHSFTGTIGFLLAVIAAMCCYFVVIFLLRTLPKSEIIMLPKGDQLVALLIRLGLLQS